MVSNLNFNDQFSCHFLELGETVSEFEVNGMVKAETTGWEASGPGAGEELPISNAPISARVPFASFTDEGSPASIQGELEANL